METKDLYTRQHGERVSKAAVMIARRGGMRQDRVEMLRYAGFLHDVGKLGVPTRVLQKNGRLSDAEFDAVALHPLHGFEITSGIEFLGEAHEGIRHHHERLDGRGYPSGLKGEEIPEFARILAVADAFDAMTSTRSYRGARPVPEALLELERCKGTQFQPEYVDLLSAAVAEEGWELADSLPPLHVVDAAASISAQGGPRCHDEPAASHDGSAA
ncbi:MAG: HD-GYP domain-containing protein [Motilibacteraceae bacterium]